MAKIVENLVVLRLCKLVKDADNENQSLINEEHLRSLEEVAQSIVGKDILVEVIVE